MAPKFRMLCDMMVAYYSDIVVLAKAQGNAEALQMGTRMLLDWTELLRRAPEA
jgi:hypothetical protein